MPASQREVYELIRDTAKDTIKIAQRKRTSESYAAGYGVSNDAVLQPAQVIAVINKIDEAIKTQTSPNSPNRAKLLQIQKTVN